MSNFSAVTDQDAFRSILDAAQTQSGTSLATLSCGQPLLVLFLRQLGCTFCREALSDIQTQRAEIECLGVRIALVHMGTEPTAAAFFEAYGFGDLDRVSDPERSLYEAFGLGRGSLSQLVGPRVWRRGLAAVRAGHGVGKLIGDSFQMPGVFLVQNAQIDAAYRHETAGDRPDYTDLACSVAPIQAQGGVERQ